MSRPKGSKNGIRKGKEPVYLEEIVDYLEGLNHVASAAIASIDTERLTAIAMNNYFDWFRSHGIHVYQEKGQYVVDLEKYRCEWLYPVCWLLLVIHSTNQIEKQWGKTDE